MENIDTDVKVQRVKRQIAERGKKRERQKNQLTNCCMVISTSSLNSSSCPSFFCTENKIKLPF